MPVDIGLLVLTAASIGFVHTLLGPDHYLPFVAMGAARRWSTRKTLWITIEPSTCPTPQRLVIHSVLRVLQRRAAPMATNGR